MIDPFTEANKDNPLRLLLDCWWALGGVRDPSQDRETLLQSIKVIISEVTGEHPKRITDLRALQFFTYFSAQDVGRDISHVWDIDLLLSRIFNREVADAMASGVSLQASKGGAFLIYQSKEPETANVQPTIQ